VTPSTVLVEEPATVSLRSAPEQRAPEFRLQPIMRQGTASSIPETWLHFPTVEDARQLVKQMYQDDRVLRVFIVTDEAPPRFVEWVER
jgi:hypothetical protein